MTLLVRMCAIVALGAAGAAACGSSTRPESARTERRPSSVPAAQTTTAAKPARERPRIDVDCEPSAAAGYRTCLRTRIGHSSRATIERRVYGRWRIVAWEAPGDISRRMSNGFWDEVWVSPDGRTLLAQWSTECEVRYAFFVPATGGTPRPVTGERDWKRRSPESIARGWAADGRARVDVLDSGCSPDFERPGLYLIDPETGAAQFVKPVEGS